jgi:DNA-binding transcriptional MerR regulator
MQERVWFKIGEAAKRAGVSAKDIRYWEKIIPELRPRRSVGNQRHYHKDDLPKLGLIAFWVKSGLPVADCRELVATAAPAMELGAEGIGAGPSVDTVAGGLEIEAGVSMARPKSRPRPGPRPLAEPLFDFPEIYGGQVQAQLQGVVDSLKALLARLQKPIP